MTLFLVQKTTASLVVSDNRDKNAQWNAVHSIYRTYVNADAVDTVVAKIVVTKTD